MKYPPVIKRGNGESLYRWVFPCFPIKAIFKLAFSSQPRLVTPEVAPYFHRHKHRSWVKRSAGSAQPLGRSPGKLGNPRCGSRRTLRGPPELRKVEWNTFFFTKMSQCIDFQVTWITGETWWNHDSYSQMAQRCQGFGPASQTSLGSRFNAGGHRLQP